MAKKRWKARKKRRRRISGSPQEVLVKGLNHAVRVKALMILTDRIASPKEIAEQIDIPLTNVSYHVRVLEELGLVEVVEEESVRGAIAHFYKAVERSLFDDPAWEKLDPNVRNAFWGCLIETILGDAAASLAAGYFDKRKDRHASRTRLLLDEKGWRAVSAIQSEALDRILKEQSAAAERMDDSEDAIQAVLAMFCFEMPPDADH